MQRHGKALSIHLQFEISGSALKHNSFERLAPHEPIEIGGHHTPTPVGCRIT